MNQPTGTNTGTFVASNNNFSATGSWMMGGYHGPGSFFVRDDGSGDFYTETDLLNRGGYIKEQNAGNIIKQQCYPGLTANDWVEVYTWPSVITRIATDRYNQAAPASIAAPYIISSAASLYDTPVPWWTIWMGKRHPWIGVHTDVVNYPGHPLLLQKIWTNLIVVSKWFNTSAWSTATSPYGIQSAIWGDYGWNTNRSGGDLQLNPTYLAMTGATTESNYWYQIHTNKVKVSLNTYRDTTMWNQFNGDTEMVFDFTKQTFVSYPSGISAGDYVISEITPDTIRRDTVHFYSNQVDELFLADQGGMSQVGGYQNQIAAFDWAALYPDTSAEQHVYWQNVNAGFTSDTGTTPPVIGRLTNQLVIGAYQDFACSQLPYMVNDVFQDQQFSITVGAESGLNMSMSNLRGYLYRGTNWPAGSVMNIDMDFNGNQNNSAWNVLAITNFFGVAEFGHMNAFIDVDTNKWTPNTNMLALTLMPLFLNLWQDNLLAQPQTIFDDGTNYLGLRAMDRGCFLVLAANQGTAAEGTSNFCQVISGSASQLALLPTNEIFTATNVMTGTAYQNGLFTNVFTNAITRTNINLVYLQPLRQAITNGGFVYWSGPLFNAASP